MTIVKSFDYMTLYTTHNTFMSRNVTLYTIHNIHMDNIKTPRFVEYLQWSKYTFVEYLQYPLHTVQADS